MAENFVCLLEETARRQPNKTALVWQGGSLSFGDLHRHASGFAADLAERGVHSGDRVCLHLPNDWSFVVALLGCFKLGATVAPISVLLKEQERGEILAALKPKEVVTEVNATSAGWKTVTETNAPALMTYSSGSSGHPKGAVFSHDALTFAERSWAGPVMGLLPEDIVLAVLPFPHSFGLHGGLLAPLLTGSTVAVVERFVPETVLEAIAAHHVKVYPGVATMFRRTLSSPAFDRTDLSSLRVAISGAAPCPWELAKEWRTRTGTRIIRGYGMTELFRPISHLAADPTEVPDAIGKPVPGVDVQLVDDNGKQVRQGEIGELLIKTPAAMNEYFEDPQGTKAVLEKGWFKTGDLAIILPNGFIQIAGRKEERILRGGYSVFPQEVEAVLLAHPAIAEAAVMGVSDPDMGEEVAAYVSLRSGANTTMADLEAHCRERLAGYKYPRRITILETLPKGPTGKVVKSLLKN
ncbi:MAG: AMP-binding protein [Deltaproteobacteria bacterium]|nr:AMP-binding protein [Deltaproteobacteria bacterium]